MAVFYSQSFAVAIAEMLRTRMASGGKLQVFDGTRPATPDTAVTSQNMLVEFTIPGPAFEAPTFDAANNRVVMPGTPVSPATSMNAGFATWARLLDFTGTPVYDGNCGNLLSNALFKISNTNVQAGSSISVASHNFIQPKA